LAALGEVSLVAVSGLGSEWLGGYLLQSLGLADRPHSMWAKVWWQLRLLWILLEERHDCCCREVLSD
jgi:hypothetical protein